MEAAMEERILPRNPEPAKHRTKISKVKRDLTQGRVPV
jgi:hypothetical protein